MGYLLFLFGGVMKIHFRDLVSGLVKEIDEIEKSDRAQGDKTRRYQGAARKFKNAVFMDKRKYRGNGMKNRISLTTFNKYLSRARSRFEERLHHSFPQSIATISNKYPAFSETIKDLDNRPAHEVRIKLKELITHLESGVNLLEKIGSLGKIKPSTAKKIVSLKKMYPSWANDLDTLISTEDATELQQKLEQGTDLLNALHSLKVNHEVMYALTMQPSDRAALKARHDAALHFKKRNIVPIDYPGYMQRMTDILHLPDIAFEDSMASLAPLAFALAAASGRRQIEILITGDFEAKNKSIIKFSGQAKKRMAVSGGHYEIYSLIDSELFIQRLDFLRSHSSILRLQNLEIAHDEHRTELSVINGLVAKPLNDAAKQFFVDDRRVFKDTRAIYARIAYEKWFRTDPRWAKCDEDVFFSELLGHDDPDTQLAYKQFKLVNFNPKWTPNISDENPRLAALQDLDSDMPGLARGDAAVRIHKWVKDQLAQNPAAKITAYQIKKNLNCRNDLASRYMAWCADALGVVIGDDGQARPEELPPSLVLDINADDTDAEEDEIEEDFTDEEIDDTEFDVSDNASDEDKHEDKPRFAAPIRRGEDSWLIKFEFAGKQYSWEGNAASVMDAMKKAWEAYM